VPGHTLTEGNPVQSTLRTTLGSESDGDSFRRCAWRMAKGPIRLHTHTCTCRPTRLYEYFMPFVAFSIWFLLFDHVSLSLPLSLYLCVSLPTLFLPILCVTALPVTR